MCSCRSIGICCCYCLLFVTVFSVVYVCFACLGFWCLFDLVGIWFCAGIGLWCDFDFLVVLFWVCSRFGFGLGVLFWCFELLRVGLWLIRFRCLIWFWITVRLFCWLLICCLLFDLFVFVLVWCFACCWFYVMVGFCGLPFRVVLTCLWWFRIWSGWNWFLMLSVLNCLLGFGLWLLVACLCLVFFVFVLCNRNLVVWFDLVWFGCIWF